MTSPELDEDGGHGTALVDRSVAPSRVDLGEGAWYETTPGFIRDASGLLTELVDSIPWSESTVWRYEKRLVEPRLGAAPPLERLPAALRHAHLAVESRHRLRLDAPVLLRYRDGRDSVALHRDREMRWLEDTIVAIVVLGSPRPFVLRPLGRARHDDSHDIALQPGDGDLLVMGGRFQNTWLHGVPKVEHATERVSVTWRWTSRGGPPDRSPSYSSPRMFSKARP